MAGQIWEVLTAVMDWIWDNLYIINVVFAIAIVFFKRKSPKEVWAWLLSLVSDCESGYVQETYVSDQGD